jgi:hypothetical protein
MRRGEAFSQPYISLSPAHQARRTFDAEFQYQPSQRRHRRHRRIN